MGFTLCRKKFRLVFNWSTEHDMEIVGAYEAKTHLAELLERVSAHVPAFWPLDVLNAQRPTSPGDSLFLAH